MDIILQAERERERREQVGKLAREYEASLKITFVPLDHGILPEAMPRDIDQILNEWFECHLRLCMGIVVERRLNGMPVIKLDSKWKASPEHEMLVLQEERYKGEATAEYAKLFDNENRTYPILSIMYVDPQSLVKTRRQVHLAFAFEIQRANQLIPVPIIVARIITVQANGKSELIMHERYNLFAAMSEMDLAHGHVQNMFNLEWILSRLYAIVFSSHGPVRRHLVMPTTTTESVRRYSVNLTMTGFLPVYPSMELYNKWKDTKGRVMVERRERMQTRIGKGKRSKETSSIDVPAPTTSKRMKTKATTEQQ